VIILHNKKIIIFHNRKTSGTSLGMLMSLISSKNDHITFHNVNLNIDKKIINKMNLNNNLLNLDFIESSKKIIRNSILFFLKKILIKRFKNKKYVVPFIIYKSKYYGHTTPEDFKNYISAKIYNNYSKFSVYRRFSDQLYSMYNHVMSYEKFISYEKWVSKNLDSFYKSSLKFYVNDLHFFNFHNMEDSLKVFCKKFKINKNLVRQYKKVKLRSKNTKFPKILKKKTKEKVMIKEKIIYKLVKQKLLSK
jgi:hypothetical protein